MIAFAVVSVIVVVSSLLWYYYCRSSWSLSSILYNT